jgi:hypothetical protein
MPIPARDLMVSVAMVLCFLNFFSARTVVVDLGAVLIEGSLLGRRARPAMMEYQNDKQR